MIVDNNAKSQIFSADTYRKSYDNFEYDLGTTVGAAYGDALMHNPLPALQRLAKGAFSQTTDLIPAEDAEAKYGLGGVLKFDAPVSDSYARGMMETKIKEMRNQQILEKGQKGFVAGAAKFGAGLGASVIDPINIATAFIPITPALKAVGAGSLVASKTFGATVTKGAISGAIGAAAVEPLPLYSAKQYQLDYDMTDSLMNIVFGGVIGGGAHGVGHFFSTRPEARSVDSSLKNMTFDRQKEVFTKNLDAIFDDRLPRLEPEFIRDAKENLRADHLTDDEFLRAVPEVMEAQLNKAIEIKKTFSDLKAKNIAARKPESITQFIKNNGGITDPGGELKSQDIKLPGLIRKGKAKIGTAQGVQTIDNQIDVVRERVFDAGFFPGKNNYDEITNDELFQAIKDDLSGKKIYKLSDLEAVKKAAYSDSAYQSLEESGFTDDMTVAQIFDELAARDFEGRRSTEADVYNELFPEHHLFDENRPDLFLEPDMDFDAPIEMTDIEARVMELEAEIKSNLDAMDDGLRRDYEDTFAEIDEEIKIAQSLKDDLNNLVTCVWAR